jgi:dihydroorotate dehydrogenase (NAD+) catalytic subunit
LASILAKEPRIVAVEVNVSCPNVKSGLVFGVDSDLLHKLIAGIKSKVGSLPVIVKLTPNITDIASAALAGEKGGADAISMINTLRGSAYIGKGEWIEGGLSGPCIKPVALYLARQVSKAVNIPIIAMGGICDTQDALEFLRIKNVRAVAVGTASFRNPAAMSQIVAELRKYCAEKGYKNFDEFKEREVN